MVGIDHVAQPVNSRPEQHIAPKGLQGVEQENKAWRPREDPRKFKFIVQHESGPDEIPGRYEGVTRISFEDFLNLLREMAPEIKSALFKRNSDNTTEVSDVSVLFGDTEFLVTMNKADENLVIHTFVTLAKNVEKLKINAFDGATPGEWGIFLQTNPVEHFEFLAETEMDNRNFFSDILPILPNRLEQIGLSFSLIYLTPQEVTQIVEFLRTLPLLKKVLFSLGTPMSLAILLEILQHSNTVEKLCIRMDETFINNNEVLWAIPNFTNLKKLELMNFTLSDYQCMDIAANCQSIRRLKIQCCNVSENGFHALMSLPQLTELHTNPIRMNLERQLTSLQKLVIYKVPLVNPDTENLANALAFMPNLTSLTLPDEFCLTEAAASIMKDVIHARRQNIVMYSLDRHTRATKADIKEIGEAPCDVFYTQDDFELFIDAWEQDHLLPLLEMIEVA